MSVQNKKLIVLMATYNGEKYLEEQIESILNQTHQPIQIVVSDDGSQDATRDILQKYDVTVLNGPRQGFSKNFFSLINCLDLEADYFAFSDQDDVWEPAKIEKAISALEQQQAKDTPLLYCGRTNLVDEYLKPFGYSPLFKRPPSFGNALVQSIAGGNTMVFNAATMNLVKKTPQHLHIISHDWWLYLLVSGAGGIVTYDPVPYIKYRQHSANLIGSNLTWRAKWLRLRRLFSGSLKQWIDTNIEHLEYMLPYLNSHASAVIIHMLRVKHKHSLIRYFTMKRHGVHRQNWQDNLVLFFAGLCCRI